MANDNLLDLFQQAELFVFDLDGTLVDSKKDISVGIGHALKTLGLPIKIEDQIADLLFQGSQGVIMDALGDHRHRFDEVFAVFSDYYKKHLLDHTRYYPGVEKILETLSSKKVAILSNKREKFCKKIIEGLDPHYNYVSILGGDSFPNKKPDPTGLKFLCETFKTHPSKTWMIGDSPVDVEAGNLTGTHTLALLEGFTSKDIMNQTSATWKMPHLLDLSQML